MQIQIKRRTLHRLGDFDVNELMDQSKAYVGPVVDEIYRQLIERDFNLNNPEMPMILAAFNIYQHSRH